MTILVELADVDYPNLEAPLAWSSDQETRWALLEEVNLWLATHPYPAWRRYGNPEHRLQDDPQTFVIRKIFFEIQAIYHTTRPGDAQVIEYNTICQQIDGDTQIGYALKVRCVEVFDKVWRELANALAVLFTKYTPDDSD